MAWLICYPTEKLPQITHDVYKAEALAYSEECYVVEVNTTNCRGSTTFWLMEDSDDLTPLQEI